MDTKDKRCLTASDEETNTMVTLQPCKPGSPMQRWNFRSYSAAYSSMMNPITHRYPGVLELIKTGQEVFEASKQLHNDTAPVRRPQPRLQAGTVSD